MKVFQTLLGLALVASMAFAQDDGAATPAEPTPVTAEGPDGGDAEDCEEAWEYVEFLKTELKNRIEIDILQNTLFQASSGSSLESTVKSTMDEILVIRDALLQRTKDIRNGEIAICPEQNIKQEEFLTQIRNSVMEILIELLSGDAANADALQEIARKLLSIRTRVNGKITEMIMLRENRVVITRDGDCDCSTFQSVVEGLDKVIECAESEEGKDADGGDCEPANTALIMILMDVDAQIKDIYTNILEQTDEEERTKQFEELTKLKDVSTALHGVLSKLTGLDPEDEEDKAKINRIIKREVKSVRSDANRALEQCIRACPGGKTCSSCGTEMIDKIMEKLNDYEITLEDLDEEAAKDEIRSNVMTFLGEINTQMTELLQKKAKLADGETLEECDIQTLEIINKAKGPLWMLVRASISGDAATLTQFIAGLKDVLLEMREQYCAGNDKPIRDDSISCETEEITQAQEFIVEIDTIIAENIFKKNDEESRRNAMLGIIDLKAVFEQRVRKLFIDDLVCEEEVEQIKTVYANKLTDCLSQMMNPRIDFSSLDRSQRVACLKDLRNEIETRRGDLLLKEIEARIAADAVEAVGDGEDGAGEA